MSLAPPIVALAELPAALREAGYGVVDAAGVAGLAGVDVAALQSLGTAWDRLPPDAYLRDGGRYRQRRHGCFTVEGRAVEPVPQRAHWQPVDYNALHGGIERWFEALDPHLTGAPAWPRLLAGLGSVCSAVAGVQRWFVEAHQFRIDTEGGIGRPTPEGAHRDGVDFVVVLLVSRRGVKGGETRVFDADGPHGVRFTLVEPWSMLMLDDARVIHESTPIQPLDATAAAGDAYRDTLVLTFRAYAFQGPPD